MSAYIEGESFAEVYEELLRECMDAPDAVCRPRDMEVRELIAPTIRVLNPLDRLYESPARSTPMRYLAGEFVWYFAMRNDVEFIAKYSAFWNQLRNEHPVQLAAPNAFGEDVGAVPAGAVNSSYGHLLMGVSDAHWEGVPVTQWEWALRSLAKDPDTRQAVLHVNRPGHQWNWMRDFPCTLSLQFLLRDRELHLVVNMRSNDLIMGLTFDMPMFSFFQETMLYNLRDQAQFEDVSLGHLTLVSGSSHIYERDYEKVESMVHDGVASVGPCAPLEVPPIIAGWGTTPMKMWKTWPLADLETIAAGDPSRADIFSPEKLNRPVYHALAQALV